MIPAPIWLWYRATYNQIDLRRCRCHAHRQRRAQHKPSAATARAAITTARAPQRRAGQKRQRDGFHRRRHQRHRTRPPRSCNTVITTGGEYVNGQLMHSNRERPDKRGPNPDGKRHHRRCHQERRFGTRSIRMAADAFRFDHEINKTQVDEWNQTAQQDNSQAADDRSKQIDAINAQLPANRRTTTRLTIRLRWPHCK